MKFNIMLMLFLCSTSMTSFSEVSQSLLEENLVNDTFLYLNKFWADKGKSLSRSTTEKYFTSDTTLVINGKEVYKGYDQFDTHFKEVGKTIRGEILFPLLDVMSKKNKIVVHFNEDIRDNHGNDYPTNVIAIFTVKNGKIQRWEEVVNSNYFCQSEAMSVVYSK